MEMTFASLELAPPILRALADAGYERPTPIQAKAIGPAMEGRDVLGCAQTGTGKTAAFSLPIIHRLLATQQETTPASPEPAPTPRGVGSMGRSRRGRDQGGRSRRDAAPADGRRVRALVLSPTRELATQICDSFAAYGKHTGLRATAIFGGVSQFRQEQALQRGVDVIVATPGRLIDLMDQGLIDFSAIQVLVLDEADRMLDMGFIQPIRRIVAALPAGSEAAPRQTLLFSATMPRDVARLAESLLRDPVRVAVNPVASTAPLIEQSVYMVPRHSKHALLEHLLASHGVERGLVFTRTKRGADQLSRKLQRAGVRVDSIHGNKSQAQRQRALDAFRTGRSRVLVATDVAARGLDVDGITHVFNFDLPDEPEAYVHRIGRTGRAGAAGAAIAFCEPGERRLLSTIERVTGGKTMPVMKLPNLPLPERRPDEDRREERDERPRTSQPRRPAPAHEHGAGGPRRTSKKKRTKRTANSANPPVPQGGRGQGQKHRKFRGPRHG